MGGVDDFRGSIGSGMSGSMSSSMAGMGSMASSMGGKALKYTEHHLDVETKLCLTKYL